MYRVDAHAHWLATSGREVKLLDTLGFKLLNISLPIGPRTLWRDRWAAMHTLTTIHPSNFAWCTTFDAEAFDTNTYADQQISYLAKDFAEGALGAKVWKNIGLSEKRECGAWLMIDDPVFTPIIEYISASGKTLLLHIADPIACWEPLNHSSPHYDYYRCNPSWHMHNVPSAPSHHELIRRRDNVIQRFPKLRIVGAHLGSMEHSLDAIAVRLTEFPNFAIDISARFADLVAHKSSWVRQFLTHFQSRVLYGTDYMSSVDASVLPLTADGLTDESELCHPYREISDEWWRYLASAGAVKTSVGLVEGLALTGDVLDKIYCKNALTWYPGI